MAVISAPAPPRQPGAAPPSARRWELDALRVAAIIGVAGIHVVGMLLGRDDLRGGGQWWAAVGIDLGLVWVVPVFVMISGALVLSPRAHAAGPRAFYRKRFARIVPALVVWHLIYLFGVRAGLKGEDLSPLKVAVWLIDAKVYTALYFLWLIAGLYLVAPAIAAFLAGGGRRRALSTAAGVIACTVLVFATSGAAALAGEARPIALGALTMWMPYVGYFVAGYALLQVTFSTRQVVLAAVVAAALLAEIVWQYGHRPAHPALQQLAPTGYFGPATAVASICVLLVAIGVGARCTPGPRVAAVLRRLSDASFGVFLVHLLVFEVMRQSVHAVAGAASLGVMLGAWAGVVTVSFGISLVAARVPYLRMIF